MIKNGNKILKSKAKKLGLWERCVCIFPKPCIYVDCSVLGAGVKVSVGEGCRGGLPGVGTAGSSTPTEQTPALQPRGQPRVVGLVGCFPMSRWLVRSSVISCQKEIALLQKDNLSGARKRPVWFPSSRH